MKKMKKLNDKEKNSKEQLHAAEKLLEEGNEKLVRALRKRDFSSASVSQSLIKLLRKRSKINRASRQSKKRTEISGRKEKEEPGENCSGRFKES